MYNNFPSVNVINGTSITTNATSTPLSASQSYSGSWTDIGQYPSVVVSVLSDTSGSLFVDFSNDGVSADSTVSYEIASGSNEVHRLTVTRPYYRVRFINAGGTQNVFKITSLVGAYTQINSALNSNIQQDADAQVVRALTEELMIAAGRFEGYSLIPKFGKNTDLDTASTPEDLWDGGGLYTGFPTGSPEEFEILSTSNNDSGSVTFTYLPSLSASAYLTTTVQINGTSAVSTGVTGSRIHTAQYNNGTPTLFNSGDITIRHKVTTSNISIVIPSGRSQSTSAVYTVPVGYTALIKRLFFRMTGSTSGTLDGALWVRVIGNSPRLRRPFSVAQNDHFEEIPYGGITVTERSDIALRIVTSSTNNLAAIGGFDVILIKN